MLTIEDNEIYLTRGDTAYIVVDVEGYEVKTGDTITLTVRKHVDDTEPVFSIITPLDESEARGIVIQPSDTKELEYGKYLYDIQIDTIYNEVFTVIEKSPFYIKEEITR